MGSPVYLSFQKLAILLEEELILRKIEVAIYYPTAHAG